MKNFYSQFSSVEGEEVYTCNADNHPQTSESREDSELNTWDHYQSRKRMQLSSEPDSLDWL